MAGFFGIAALDTAGAAWWRRQRHSSSIGD
jgi:hypothetical protein